MDFRKKTFFIIIGVIVVYALFVIFSDASLLIEKFRHFDSKYLFAIIPLVLLSYLIRGMRWNMLLKSLDINITVKQSLEIYFAGLAFGITPAKIGEVVKSYILKKNHSQPISKTAPIVFVERYYDLVGIILISLIGIWFVNLEKIMIILLFIGAVSILVLSQRRSLVESILKKISTIPILKKYLVNILSTFDSIHVLLRPRIYTKGIAYSILAWGIESLAVYMIFQGFKIELDFPIVVLIFTLSTIIGGLSMLPGGIGVTEGGMLGLLLLYNIDYTVAFGLVLMVRVFTLWFSVIIGIIFLKFKI